MGQGQSTEEMDYYPVNVHHPKADRPDRSKNQLIYQIGGQLYFVSNDSIPYEIRRQLGDNLSHVGQGSHTWHMAGYKHLGFSVQEARSQGTVEAGGHRMGQVSANSATFNPSYNGDSSDKAASDKFIRSAKRALGV